MEKRKSIDSKHVWEVLTQLGLHTHYLGSKAVEQWDEYDHSNYRSLRIKAGKTKPIKVFAIYTSDVEEEDKYLVTTQPTFFFDTQEEAEEEIERFYKEKGHKRNSVKIMSLWKIE